MAGSSTNPNFSIPTNYYGECLLKNHTNSSQDPIGCLQFQSDVHSNDGLTCLVCGCHRVFHRQISIPSETFCNSTSFSPPLNPLNPTPQRVKNVSGSEYKKYFEQQRAMRAKIPFEFRSMEEAREYLKSNHGYGSTKRATNFQAPVEPKVEAKHNDEDVVGTGSKKRNEGGSTSKKGLKSAKKEKRP